MAWEPPASPLAADRRRRPHRGRHRLRLRRAADRDADPERSRPRRRLAHRVRLGERRGDRRGRARQDQARGVPDQGEPHVRHDVRDLPGRGRRDGGSDVRRTDAAARTGGRPGRRRRTQLRRRHHRDQRRPDELLQPDRLRAVPAGRHPELLELRAALHAGGRVLLLDLWADRRRAPVDVRIAVRSLRRSRATRTVRHRSAGVLRRPERARVLAAEGRSDGTGAHLQPGGTGRRGRRRDPDPLPAALAVHGRRGAPRPPGGRRAVAGRSTSARTSGCSRSGWCAMCASARCTTTS